MIAVLPPCFFHTVMVSCGINQPSKKGWLAPAIEVGAGKDANVFLAKPTSVS
jgi:hypothetical protein